MHKMCFKCSLRMGRWFRNVFWERWPELDLIKKHYLCGYWSDRIGKGIPGWELRIYKVYKIRNGVLCKYVAQFWWNREAEQQMLKAYSMWTSHRFWLKKAPSLYFNDCQGGKGIAKNCTVALKSSTCKWWLFLLTSHWTKQVTYMAMTNLQGDREVQSPICTEGGEIE